MDRSIAPSLGETGKGSRFVTKLFISFALLCILPILIVVQIFFGSAKDRIVETSTQLAGLLAAQLGTSLDTYIAQVENASLTIYSDYELVDYIGRETRYTDSERIRLNLLLHRQLSTFMTQLPHLHGVALLASSGIAYNNGYAPDVTDSAFWDKWLSRIREAGGKLVIVPTHAQLYHPSGAVVGVFSAGRLVQDIEGREAGILLFQLSPHRLVAGSEPADGAALPFRRRIVIETPEHALVYDSALAAAAFAPERAAPELAPHAWVLGYGSGERLQVTVAVPMEELRSEIGASRELALLIAASAVCAMLVISMLLSYQISRPISRLIRHMRQLEDGRYLPIPERGLNVELGALTRTYNLMVARIKHLIQDVYQARIRQDEARWRALQNQINPHWLYNTLESIRMQAYLDQAPDVAAMIKSLGRMFQLTLADDQTHTLADELQYIGLYMELQNIRFDHRFRLEVELGAAWMRMPLMKMTLQPIVENAIVHGFVDQDRAYRVRIHGTLGPDGQARLHVADDGEGMSAFALARLQAQLQAADVREQSPAGEVVATEPAEADAERPQSSIGLGNVHRRLRLQYGCGCGLDVVSGPGEGTTVTVALPSGGLHEQGQFD
ncbi:histidine kinase [Paenibacillus sp. IB182496]|uniref:Histidine kinase n=1 Tax=Paenibacillus sabuli TaxID=2772509 RepID=A0A927GRD7_9BACL|nr:histidine kinase [Paenibacillus sabuli]MBD2845519.1 histidine kinase [Paenibacillus sabuli]